MSSIVGHINFFCASKFLFSLAVHVLHTLLSLNMLNAVKYMYKVYELTYQYTNMQPAFNFFQYQLPYMWIEKACCNTLFAALIYIGTEMNFHLIW